MSQHAGPPRAGEAPAVPEPTFAERARTLAYLGRTGTLATLARRPAGHPFASLMPYALDAGGHPLLLISAMAVHTQNLEADPRASLLITQPGLPPGGGRPRGGPAPAARRRPPPPRGGRRRRARRLPRAARPGPPLGGLRGLRL